MAVIALNGRLWDFYKLKHIQKIENFIRPNAKNPSLTEVWSEPVLNDVWEGCRIGGI